MAFVQLDRVIQKLDNRNWGLTASKVFLIERGAVLTVQTTGLS